MSNKKTMMRKTFRKRNGGNTKIYYSSTEVRAVSNDGGKKWHVDTDINGKKRHANLTNHDIMDILSYPASKKDLRARLLDDFNVEHQIMRNERNTRNTRKKIYS